MNAQQRQCQAVFPDGRERCWINAGHTGPHYRMSHDDYWDEKGTYYLDEPNEPLVFTPWPTA